MVGFWAFPTTLLGLLLFFFSIWMIVDCIRRDNSPVWIALIIVSGPTGIGAIVYFLYNMLPNLEWTARAISRVKGGRRLDELRAQILSMDRPWHYIQLGNALREQRRWREAAEAYRGALEREPGNEEASYGLGLCLLALQELDAALHELEPLAAANPRFEYGGALLGVARARRGQGRLAEAAGAYEELLRHYHYSDVRYEYGQLLWAVGRHNEAREMMAMISRDAAATTGFARHRERRWGRRARAFLRAHQSL